MTPKKASFGRTLRAYRLGFREMFPIGFVRIRADGPPWAVDIVPLAKGDFPNVHGSHAVWWEGNTQLVTETVRSQCLKEPEEPITIWLNDDGGKAARHP